MNKKNKRVAMIGLGAMGTALAESLLEDKIEIHIWNRSPNKTEALEQKGASTHLKPHNAIELCDLVVICLSNYDAWKVIVDDKKTQTSLKNKTVVQLSTGSMTEVEDNSSVMKNFGAELIEGSILCFPEQIGTERASIILAGKSKLIKCYESILKIMSPKISYLGESITAPVVLANAIMSSVLGFSFGLINGAAFCLNGNVPLEAFKEQTIHNFARMQTEPVRILDAILSNDTISTQASVSTWFDAHKKLLKISDKLGVDKKFHTGLNLILKDTIDKDLGGHDISSIIKTFSK